MTHGSTDSKSNHSQPSKIYEVRLTKTMICAGC